MYINFWYVAAESAAVTFAADKPIKVMMLGQNFALWRDTKGKVNCVSDTCSHRSGALSDGRIRNGCLECPYHGWTFNGDGSCVRLPSLGADARIPERTRVDAYPVEERYGLIHVFLGDLPEAERPPIQPAPEYGDPDWQFIALTMDWEIDYKRSVENTMDPAHNEFTHDTHGFMGIKKDYRVAEIELKDEDWGTGFMSPMQAPPLAQKDMREASGKQTAGIAYAGSGNHGPNATWTHIHTSETAWMRGFAFHTPIHEKLDRIYVLAGRNFITDPCYDTTFEKRALYVAGQDKDVLEPIHPKLGSRSAKHEFLMPADKAIARYRDYCEDWEARGWRIDVGKMRADYDHVAYAIPSPARRRSKGWVLPAVPLLPARELAKTSRTG